MKTKIIIASHGRFAEGIMDSLKMIAGEQDHVEPLCAYIDRSVDYSARIRQLVADHDYEKQALLVITDLLGGSVNNEFMRFTEDYPFYLVSGLNLSLLLELALYPDELKSDTIQKIVEQNSDYIVFCSGDTLHLQEENDF